VQLFHYHLVSSKVRLLEARYLGKLGFELLGRYGWRGEASEWFEAGTSWEELDALGFRLRLVELSRGAVNVVLQPGHWEHPRIDHIGIALDDDGYTEALERAADLGLKIQDHPGKRTFIATEAGYRLEVHPPREWIDELLTRSDELRLGELHLRAQDPEDKAIALAEILGVDRLDSDVLIGDTLLRFQERARGEAGAGRRGDAVSSYGEAGVSLAKAEEVVERLRAAVESTRTDRVEGSLGAFAGLFALDEERLLAATTDGVGTKLVLSRRAGRLFDAGVDLAAHCANDLASTGRRTALLPDYAAAVSSTLAEVADLVAGAASAPRGRLRTRRRDRRVPASTRGEPTSPGRWSDRPARRLGRFRREPGDGARPPVERAARNGFTLVRGLLGDDGFDPDLLLPPTRALPGRRDACAPATVRALAHVTGGGIPGNSPARPPCAGSGPPRPESWERPGARAWLTARRAGGGAAASSTSASASARSWQRRTRRAPASP
jgi:phosphoribosylformylglycinamidine cyclo-ligase